MQIQIADQLNEADEAHIVDALKAHNREYARPDLRKLSVVVRDSSGVIQAGLLGQTHWGCLRIDILWVDDSCRGQGLGAQMLDAALSESGARGCASAVVETMAFQARDFYEKQGFEVFGTLDGGRPELTCFYLRKKITG